jgi:hypothetical protein
MTYLDKVKANRVEGDALIKEYLRVLDLVNAGSYGGGRFVFAEQLHVFVIRHVLESEPVHKYLIDHGR